MSNHTPGPWEWWTSNSWRRLRYSHRGVSENVLLPFVCRDGQPDIDVKPSDMALIAAAPDMLAALKAVVAIADRRTDEFDAARAAIAKAEGCAALSSTRRAP